MPSSIPFNHPSLVLGSIADTRVLGLLTQIDACQSRIDAAQDKLNSLVMMKRSIAMTVNELTDLDINVDDILTKQEELDSEISTAASAYLASRMENETQIQSLREQLSEPTLAEGGAENSSMESPVDFSASVLKQLPLSAESIKFDSQFFSFGGNLQSDALASVEKFVRSSTRNMGGHSNAISQTVTDQISSQFQNHGISGTLVITASCTHRNVTLFEPLVLDPDKSVAVWNAINADKIDTEGLKQGEPVAESQDASASEALHLVSGACYGSSFIGMIHLLKNDTSQSSDMNKIKDQLEGKLRASGWLQNSTGGIGVDESTLNEVKAFLSTQSISAHVGMVVMGAVPAIKSSNLSMSVRKMAEYDPAITAAIESNSSSESATQGTIDSEAESAITNKKILAIQNSRVASMMKTLGEIDQGQSKSLDINTLMNAFENYIEAITTSGQNCGVPVSFYLKKITKPEIVELWRGKYLKSSSDAQG